MPNWVQNKVIMKGINNLPLFTDYQDGTNLDFNQILPMPYALNIESSSRNGEAALYYLTDRMPGRVKDLDDKKKAMLEAIAKECFGFDILNPSPAVLNRIGMETDDPVKEAAFYKHGQTLVENYEAYGATTWYKWCIQNWGTKWNAGESHCVGEDVVLFQTAWDPPLPVFQKLSEQYPNEVITLIWEDEGRDENKGAVVFVDGEMHEEPDLFEPLW